MKCKRNKRTLKKRVRKSMFLCIFITIVLFGITMMYITAQTFKQQSTMLSQYFSNSMANTINSQYFLDQMKIKDLKAFNPASPMAKEWLNSLNNSVNKDNGNKSLKVNTPDFSYTLDSKDMIFTHIKLNNIMIYPNEQINNKNSIPGFVDKTNGHGISMFNKMLNSFKTSSTSNLYDSNKNVIGYVTVDINAEFPLTMQMIIVGTVIFVGLILLIIINFISKFLTLPITIPIRQLEEKSRAIATGDYDGAINSQIVLKKPLAEIESLANSTNLIIQKNKEYNDLLENQKVILENQNEELEAQNEELIESKKKIEEAQTMLVQSQNMASIGQLTAAITHEINTPLGAINSNVQMYQMLLNSLSECTILLNKEEVSELVDQMKEANQISIMACQRVTEIIRSLKNFTRLDQAEFQEANVNEGIRSVLILTSNLWKKKIALHEDYGDLLRIKCFPGLLNQVFMNVIVNAIHSIENNGDIYIKTYMENNFVQISIKDTGSGIKEEHLPKIFESGFSTKTDGAGAGLGLSICQSIISKHNGQIKVLSKFGEGTEFIISIPVNN